MQPRSHRTACAPQACGEGRDGRILGKTAYRFLTHDRGYPLTFGLVFDRREHDAARATAGLEQFAEAANSHPGACAWGKIAVLASDGIHTFQATADGQVLPVFCGNSTAAAIARLAGEGDVRTRLHGPSPLPYEVNAHAGDAGVRQAWTLPPGLVEERMWRGRQVICARAFNDYAIVIGDLPDGLSAEEARRELLGCLHAGKLAIVAGAKGSMVVEFHNANGRHGAVPQTGAATIALAARTTVALADCFPDNRLTYLTGEGLRSAALPAIVPVGEGTMALEMPRIAVKLAPHIAELAA